LRKNAEVTALEYRDDHFVITINNQETIDSKYVINATGVDTDDIAILIEKSTPVNILPRKGEYFVLDKRVQGFVNHVLYPLPTEAGKGVLLTPQVHGNILVGPNSISVDDKRRTNTTYEGLEYVRKHADALAENIPYNKIIRSFAGIRASSDYDDFYIQESKKFKGLYHLAGIDSPGLTAAPAIAKYLVNEVINVSKEYQVNESFNPYRHKNPEFSTLPMEEQHDLIKQFPTYGNIICKCEKITEKEIVDAMKGPMGSDTIKGIKKRTRAGAGLCQGGYCEEKIMKLIAREKSISPLDVRYDGVNSNLFTSETKVKK
ncbi:MAG TPA: FAD-dependent oxidoreductase, partial [Bacillota bacterium]|nr:FAD-dependent oxidoreductase [Bacillota bacterium]